MSAATVSPPPATATRRPAPTRSAAHLAAATVAALTVYDMAKAVDKRMVIGDVHLVSKTGGRSGDFTWET